MQAVHKTIGQILAEVAEEHPQSDALVHIPSGVSWSHSRLQEKIDQTAAGMLAIGFQPGDRIALWAPNLAQWLVAFLALARMGAVVIPIDPAASEENLGYILDQSQSRALIFAAGDEDQERIELAAGLTASLPELETAVAIGDPDREGMITWRQLQAAGSDMNEDGFNEHISRVAPEDPVAIMYTSGTTGAPKGVVLDHLGLINKSLYATERQGITPADRLCLFFPLFHMFGNTCIALSGLIRAAALIMPCESFDPAAILKAVPAHGCTAVYGSPSMLISLLDHPDFDKGDWATVKKGIIGGAPCPMELMRRMVTDIGITDITVAWGITETASWITMTRPEDPVDLRVATIGTPLDCSEVKIVDPRSGRTLPAGEQGELCTRGFLMKEYYRMPGATAAAVDREGWFHTGDLGTMDENGYVRITGRLKDVIVCGGVDIYPVEIEEAVYELPQVSEVQVFGFEDATGERQIAAWLKVKEGARLPLAEVASHLKRRLPPEKQPRHFKIVDSFPMTGSGKVQKYRLAEMAAGEYGRGR